MISWAIVFLAGVLGGLIVYFWRGATIARLSARAGALDEMLKEERLLREKSTQQAQLAVSMDDLKKQFREHQALIQKTEKEHAQMYGHIESSLKQVVDVGQSMRMEVAAFKKALTSSSGVQGNVGQILLEDILQRNGFVKGQHYRTQVVLENDDQRTLRPDVILMLPEHKELVIDSKAPIQEFILASEAEDPARRKEHCLKLVSNIRDHMNKLSKKEYQRLVDSDIQFVLMFVPDGPLQAACAEDPTLLEDGRVKNVLLASQMTILPLILLISYAWKQYNLAASAKQLGAEVETLWRYLETFVDHVRGMGHGIEETMTAWNKAVASWKSRTTPQLEKIKNLSGNLKEVPQPEELAQELTEWPLRKNPNLLE